MNSRLYNFSYIIENYIKRKSDTVTQIDINRYIISHIINKCNLFRYNNGNKPFVFINRNDFYIINDSKFFRLDKNNNFHVMSHIIYINDNLKQNEFFISDNLKDIEIYYRNDKINKLLNI